MAAVRFSVGAGPTTATAWPIRILALLAWLGSFALPTIALAADAPAPLERMVKAAFIYKFLSFVEWPEQSLARADSPLVIGVYNAEDIANELAPMVQGRTLGSRPMEVRRLKEGDSLAGLHVLFIGRGDKATLARITRLAQQQSILTISETEGALDAGAVINLVVIDGRVRFEIALDNAERSRLKLSSRLLALAFNVRNSGA